MPDKDYLWPQLLELPYFRALLRAVEARFYGQIDLPEPLLDLGCGDGHFASHAFDHPITVGLDPGFGPIREAAYRRTYCCLVLADGGRIPFPDGYFASAMSNSVLEHIPHVEMVLSELARVMRPGGRFVFSVPNHRFPEQLSVGRAFDRLGLPRLGAAYRGFFNRISRHAHCDPPEKWQVRLAQAGFTVEGWWNYFSPAALFTLEWGHYLGLPSLLSRWLSGRWILVPTPWNLAFTERLVRRYYEEPSQRDDGAYTFFIVRRVDGD